MPTPAPSPPASSPAASPDAAHPWRTAGLLSTHYLTQRLAAPGSAMWPDAAAADVVFYRMHALYSRTIVGLRKGDEEDCEKRFISPVLDLLGFGVNYRKAIPGIEQRRLPDYLLYPAQPIADAAFEVGSREGYYADAIGLLEAKRWGHNLSEDASGRGKAPRGRSPHHQIRDYLGETDRLAWGVLTNGAKWRLYCKRERASSFFEFDLEAVLADPDAEAAQAAFRWFYALFRVEVFARGPDGRCGLDAISEGAQSFRAEVERELRAQVFDGVRLLGQAFLDNPANRLGVADLPVVYEHALILLYRVLFVLNAEARGLLPTRSDNTRDRRYVNSYSLELIRQKLGSLGSPEAAGEYAEDDQFTLFERLQGLFRLINGQPPAAGKVDKNEELGIPRYNGGLFDPARFPFLETMKVADAYLRQVLALLFFRREPGGGLTAFDYATLGERHLGSIYEGLLEYRFVMEGGADHPNAVALVNAQGERKLLGAYYTPEAWVAYIVEHSLRPLLERVDAESGARDADPPPDAFAESVLQLNVCDPAMGSGHFLVEAVTVLAEAIAAHPSTAPRPELTADGRPRLKTDGSGEPLCTQEAKLGHWRRRVVEACIYGVDVNPLAVELAKLSLWLKTVDRRPLNFLDHHLRCGDSLVGTRVDLLGAPRNPKKRHADGPDGPGPVVQLPLGLNADLAGALGDAIAEILDIEGQATDTIDAAKHKEARWKHMSEALMPRFRRIADLWMAPWFGVPVSAEQYASALDDPARAEALHAEHAAALDSLRFFHWELEFPDIFFGEDGRRKVAGRGGAGGTGEGPGFDAVIGNPPWERIKLQENEFFAARSPAIATAPRASDRKRLIAALPKTDPALWAEYQAARTRTDQTLAFVQRAGLYPLMGRGDTNLYAVFAEKALDLVNPRGRVGILVPSGIATDHTTQHFFKKLIDERRLAELLDFENREAIFQDVHRSFKFSVILMAGGDPPQDTVRAGFFLHRMADLEDPERTFTLEPADFALFNPNTLTCPIFRRRRDYELTRQIYERVPVLIDKAKGEAGNPWGIRFATMFHMTNDSHLFRTAKELEDAGFWLGVGNVYTRGAEQCLPLYEGKMVQMYDHRAASVMVNPANIHRPAQEQATTAEQYADPEYSPISQFWVNSDEVAAALPRGESKWFLGYKDVTAPTNVRTMIPAIIPYAGVGNTFCLVIPAEEPSLSACLLANLSSYALDFAARQKVGGQHLNFFIVEQLPILPPSRYAEPFHGRPLVDFIAPRVLELCYTARDLAGFAADMGYAGAPFGWDEERRVHLRCQLDALYFLLYGLSRTEAAEILGTFPIVRRQDEARWGRFRTQELVLAYYNALAAGNLDAWVKG